MSIFNKKNFTSVVEKSKKEEEKIILPQSLEDHIKKEIDEMAKNYNDTNYRKGYILFITEQNNVIKNNVSAQKLEDSFFQTILNQKIFDHNSANPTDKIKFSLRIANAFVKVTKLDEGANRKDAEKEANLNDESIKKAVLKKLLGDFDKSIDDSMESLKNLADLDKEVFRERMMEALEEVSSSMGYQNNVVVEVEGDDFVLFRSYDVIETKSGTFTYAAISHKPDTEQSLPADEFKKFNF